jgi:uncharacterized protein (DUF1330 family)/ketosteroid isomerase-like protein
MHRQITIIAIIVVFAAVIAVGDDATITSEEAVTTSDAEAVAPVVLVIQGELKPGGEAEYQRYLAGTGPLMAEYGAEVVMVGRGVASDHTSDAWPVNAMLRFPDRAAAEAFLADPRYLEIKGAHRDQAYETLHLTLVETRTPEVRTPKAVAEEAFEDFRSGLATGDWAPFLARLSEDFSFHFPLGRFQGLNHGKDRAAEFFAFVSQVYADGLFVDEVLGVTAEGNRVVFEFSDHGLMFGEPYANKVAISLDVCGELICGYREYFGLVGPPPSDGNGG